jgi:transcriptional regulator with XRE-family HTH domain
MDIEAPLTIPGSRLRAQREAYGVARTHLADRLGLHRNTLLGWERESALDVIRQRRYLAALRQLVEEQSPEDAA